MNRSPNIIEIDLSALIKNYRALQDICGSTEIIPVLKGNAYGHGLVECAKALDSLATYGFGVGDVQEAITLRKAGILRNIIILRESTIDELALAIVNNCIMTVSSAENLQLLEEYAKTTKTRPLLHLKLPLFEKEALKLLLIKSSQVANVQIHGVFAHVSCLPSDQYQNVEAVIDTFSKLSLQLEKKIGHALIKHFHNSQAIFTLQSKLLDVVRSGAALYGLEVPFEYQDTHFFSQVMRVSSKVISIKKLRPGEWNFYDTKVSFKQITNLAVVPIGYANGIPYHHENKFSVFIAGRSYKIVGTVRMNQIYVDIGLDAISPGDSVEIISSNYKDSNCIDSLAKTLSIPTTALTTAFGNNNKKQFQNYRKNTYRIRNQINSNENSFFMHDTSPQIVNVT